MSQLLQAIIDGLLIGGVYGVISVGLSLVFGVLGIVNFAQAEFLMIGMYVAWFAWTWLGLDPVLASVLSFVVGFLMGAAIQVTLVRRIMTAPHVAQIFLTVGLLAVLENGALMLFGSTYRSVQTHYQTSALKLGPLFVSVPYLLAFGAAVLVSVGLWWLMARTWLGRAIRATAQNEMAARAFGINTTRIYAVALGIGTGLTAFGGAIILPYATASPAVGTQFVVLMFTVVVLGGLGSVMGALLGGLAVGIIQSLSALVLPIQLQNLAIFVVFIALLAFRPEGLLGKAGR